VWVLAIEICMNSVRGVLFRFKLSALISGSRLLLASAYITTASSLRRFEICYFDPPTQLEAMQMAATMEVPLASFPAPYYSSGLREKYRIDELKLQVDRTPGHENYADIDYEANEDKFHARSALRLAAGGLETEVPTGWPKHLKHPLVWSGTDFIDENEYVIILTEQEKKEVVAALNYFKGTALKHCCRLTQDEKLTLAPEQELEGEDVDRDSFPLPTLGPRLEKVRDDIYEGRGFSIIRGLEPNDFSVEDFTVIYLGITSYVAERRGKQDQRGSMLSTKPFSCH